MLKRYLKIALISSFIGIGSSYLFVEFFYKKVSDELVIYQENRIKLQSLADSYALCVGLYNANPSKKREKLCKYIKKEVLKEVQTIQTQYPYTNFYNKYFAK